MGQVRISGNNAGGSQAPVMIRKTCCEQLLSLQPSALRADSASVRYYTPWTVSCHLCGEILLSFSVGRRPVFLGSWLTLGLGQLSSLNQLLLQGFSSGQLRRGTLLRLTELALI